jgi:hypothetical protein
MLKLLPAPATLIPVAPGGSCSFSGNQSFLIIKKVFSIVKITSKNSFSDKSVSKFTAIAFDDH